MNRIKKKLGMLSGLLLFLLLVSSALVVPVLASPYPYVLTDTEVANALAYIRGQQAEDGSVGGFGPSAWVVMAIVAAGEDPHDWKVGGNSSIVDYLRTETTPGKLASELNPTNAYARTILAIVAAGESPADFGGVDYVAGIKTYYDGNQMGSSDLVNDDFWGVMALIAAGESPNSETIQNSVSFIKSCQQADGGWGFDPSASWGTDVDSTSAAMTALVAAGESPSSNTITNGLTYIKSTQMDNGGFESWGLTNADTDSWAISAIVATGQDPTSASWTENGNTPVDDLLSFQQGDGSFYLQSDSPGAWPCQTTAWAIQALLGKPYFTTVATGFASIQEDLNIAYGYKAGEGTGGWTVYNPGWAVAHPEGNTLMLLHKGRGYWINVNTECILTYGTDTYYLDEGWNLIGWLD